MCTNSTNLALLLLSWNKLPFKKLCAFNMHKTVILRLPHSPQWVSMETNGLPGTFWRLHITGRSAMFDHIWRHFVTISQSGTLWLSLLTLFYVHHSGMDIKTLFPTMPGVLEGAVYRKSSSISLSSVPQGHSRKPPNVMQQLNKVQLMFITSTSSSINGCDITCVPTWIQPS